MGINKEQNNYTQFNYFTILHNYRINSHAVIEKLS